MSDGADALKTRIRRLVRDPEYQVGQLVVIHTKPRQLGRMVAPGDGQWHVLPTESMHEAASHAALVASGENLRWWSLDSVKDRIRARLGASGAHRGGVRNFPAKTGT